MSTFFRLPSFCITFHSSPPEAPAQPSPLLVYSPPAFAAAVAAGAVPPSAAAQLSALAAAAPAAAKVPLTSLVSAAAPVAAAATIVSPGHPIPLQTQQQQHPQQQMVVTPHRYSGADIATLLGADRRFSKFLRFVGGADDEDPAPSPPLPSLLVPPASPGHGAAAGLGTPAAVAATAVGGDKALSPYERQLRGLLAHMRLFSARVTEAWVRRFAEHQVRCVNDLFVAVATASRDVSAALGVMARSQQRASVASLAGRSRSQVSGVTAIDEPLGATSAVSNPGSRRPEAGSTISTTTPTTAVAAMASSGQRLSTGGAAPDLLSTPSRLSTTRGAELASDMPFSALPARSPGRPYASGLIPSTTKVARPVTGIAGMALRGAASAASYQTGGGALAATGSSGGALLATLHAFQPPEEHRRAQLSPQGRVEQPQTSVLSASLMNQSQASSPSPPPPPSSGSPASQASKMSSVATTRHRRSVSSSVSSCAVPPTSSHSRATTMSSAVRTERMMRADLANRAAERATVPAAARTVQETSKAFDRVYLQVSCCR